MITLPLEKLELDSSSVRLPRNIQGDTLAAFNYLSQSIDGLKESIAMLGFFAGEPLIVVPSVAQNGAYTVIDGNRRLVAVRVLMSAQDSVFLVEELPVVIMPDRQSVMPFLGIHHHTGVRPWSALSRARYMQQQMDHDLTMTINCDNIARSMDCRSSFVRKNLDALAVYQVIEEAGFYGIDELSEQTVKFETLINAITYDGLSVFLGTKKADTDNNLIHTESIRHPHELHIDHIYEFTHWLYEKTNTAKQSRFTKINSAQALRDLSCVVSRPISLRAYRHGETLVNALRTPTRGATNNYYT